VTNRRVKQTSDEFSRRVADRDMERVSAYLHSIRLLPKERRFPKGVMQTRADRKRANRNRRQGPGWKGRKGAGGGMTGRVAVAVMREERERRDVRL
jgi:hypothetical protein